MKKFYVHKDDIIVFAVGALLISLVVFLVGALINLEAEWVKFKKDHHCKIVAHISGDVFNTFGISGSGNMVVGVGATPDKEGWLCDDGVTYYR